MTTLAPRTRRRREAVEDAAIVSYGALTAVERIGRIKAGIPATEAKSILAGLGLGQAEGLKALNLSQATVNKKAKQNTVLAPDESERVIGVARLLDQVESMARESGYPAGFDAAQWLAHWLRDPVPALGGRRPVDLMDTMEGQALVSTTLARMQSGAYA